MDELTIEPSGQKDSGPCACCGNNTRCVWGFVQGQGIDSTVAAFFVYWTLNGVPQHGATFDLILGRWGEETTAADRVLVSLAYRLGDQGPGFMVVDADNRPAAKSDLVGRVMKRAEVVGQPDAQLAFAVVDTILRRDPRVAELLGRKETPTPEA